MAQQRDLRHFVRRDLERRHERVDEVDRFLVEDRREEEDPALLAARDELRQPFVRQLELGHDVVDRPVELQVLADTGALRIEAVGPEDLELDGVGLRGGGGVDQRERLLEAAVVVRPGLRDHEARMSVADDAVADVNRAHHAAAGQTPGLGVMSISFTPSAVR